MGMLILLLSWLIVAFANFAFFYFYEGRNGNLLDEIDEELGVILTVVPVVNMLVFIVIVIFCLMLALTKSFKALVKFIKRSSSKYENKKIERKKLKQQQIQKMKMEEKGGILLYVFKILETKANNIPQFTEIKELLFETVQIVERNEDEEEIQKTMIQYEEVFKNVFEAMNYSIKVKNYVTTEIADEILDICESYVSSLKSQEEKILQKISKNLKFEKEYIKKINTNN